MSFEEFQHFARLYVVGALDEEEMASFEQARMEFGADADRYIGDCQKLNAAFALSLRPMPPRADAKAKLMRLIRSSPAEKRTPTQRV